MCVHGRILLAEPIRWLQQNHKKKQNSTNPAEPKTQAIFKFLVILWDGPVRVHFLNFKPYMHWMPQWRSWTKMLPFILCWVMWGMVGWQAYTRPSVRVEPCLHDRFDATFSNMLLRIKAYLWNNIGATSTFGLK